MFKRLLTHGLLYEAIVHCFGGPWFESLFFSFQITIKSATGLPPSLSHFVFCQYMFWGDSDLTVVPPRVNLSSSGDLRDGDFLGGQNDSAVFQFNHTREVFVTVSEEFMEHCSEGALSIEVYGHRSAGLESEAGWAERQQLAKSLADRSVGIGTNNFKLLSGF